MTLSVHKVDEEHLEEIQKWWNDKNVLPLSLGFFNDGYIVYKEDMPVCCGCVFIDEKRFVSWIGFVIMNPEVRSKERTECFSALIKQLESKAVEAGCRIIYTPANNPSLVSRLNINGYTVGDLDVIDMFKIVGG